MLLKDDQLKFHISHTPKKHLIHYECDFYTNNVNFSKIMEGKNEIPKFLMEILGFGIKLHNLTLQKLSCPMAGCIKFHLQEQRFIRSPNHLPFELQQESYELNSNPI